MNIVLRIRGQAIDGQSVCCLGSQLAQIVEALSKPLGEVVWYVADVDAMGEFYKAFPANPTRVGNSHQFIELIQRVDQFLSGVFLAVKAEISVPHFRADISTEDSVDAELEDAIVEVRAFDTSYFEVLTGDERLAAPLTAAFQCPISVSP